MIVYKELSSLTNDLGFSVKALYSASNHISSHYHKAKILKKTGEYRELSVPDDFLKSIQKRIVEKLLVYEEVSPYATAYRYSTSIIKNARVHLHNNTILKLDIRHFFDHIIYPVVKEKAFPKEKYSEENRILLSLLCLYHDALPQGAPTSPIISNIIMKDFDNTVGAWCKSKKIRYTRYCDDMTFSGDFNIREVISFIKRELGKMGFYLNDAKTVVARSGQKQIVTGIVVNDKLNTPLLYRKKLRQELYYCKKFGIASHLRQKSIDMSEREYILKLLGRVNFVLSVGQTNKEMQEYKSWLLDQNNLFITEK
ncbi:MAG: RNA-directed DNA polymerase [Ruminococcaceae bacterium]|nr:RNA-directed DNA polymerase [Oscillospiraceae bacterium]